MAGKGELAILVTAKNEASNILKELSTNVGNMGDDFEKLSRKAALAGTAVVAAMSAIAFTTAHAADEIKDMSARTGVSTQSLQELAYAAQFCGTNIDTIEVAIKNMSRGIVDAANGSQSYNDALTKIGLNYQQLMAMTPEQQFFAMADGLSQVTDATERSALAQELFGSRIGTQLLPMFAEGAEGLAGMRKEAEELGVVMGDDAIEAADGFYDSTIRLKSSLSGLKNEVAVSIMPVLDGFINKLLLPGLRAFKTLVNAIPGPLKELAAGILFVGGGFLATAGTVGLAYGAFKKAWPLVVDGTKILGDLVGPVLRAGAALWDFAVGIVTKVIPALIAKLALLGPWGWAILAASAAIIAGAIIGIKALVSGGGGGGGGTEFPSLEGLEKTSEETGGKGAEGGEEIPEAQTGAFVRGSARGTLVRVGENFTDETISPVGSQAQVVNVNMNFAKGAFTVRSDEDIELIAEALHTKIVRAERRLSD